MWECVLPQNHTTGAQQPCYDNKQAQPPHRIEDKHCGKGQQSPRYPTNGCSMSADFPKQIDDGTHHLNGKRRHQYATHKMRYMEHVHEIVAKEITHDGNNVGHHAALLDTHLVECPPLIVAIETNEQGGKQHRTQVHDEQ